MSQSSNQRGEFEHSKKIKMNKFWITVLVMVAITALLIDNRYVKQNEDFVERYTKA